MKKILVGAMAFFIAGSFMACSNDATSDTNEDSTINTATTTTTTSGDYAAMADEFERNSAANKYMDPRTGQPIRITVDRTTGRKVNASTNEPITRYIFVDNNDWWLYDDAGERLGRARLDNGRVLYDDNGNWVEYEESKWKVDGDEMKYKSGDTKIKVEGDEMKIKTDDQKIKVDEDGTKVKRDN